MIETLISESPAVQDLINQAFKEDIGTGDVTTNAIIGKTSRASGVWIAKERGIVAGLDIAQMVFEYLDPQIVWAPKVSDGEQVEAGTELVSLKGKSRALLTAERIALNFVQRLSGIATMTHRFVDAIGDLPTRILDTRKTVPGWRLLDKYAVAAGGGTNHRLGLFDRAMIKDNHIVAAGSIGKAVQAVRDQNADLIVEVETTSLEGVREALSADADIIMLDNMELDLMAKAVALVDTQAETEASGNITLNRVRKVAETGVDYISIGALTHSVKAFDISQQLQNIYP